MNTAPPAVATPADFDRSAATLTLAFAADPACRWAWPDAAQYLDAFPEFVRAFGGRAFESDAAFLADDGAGVALWLPPGEAADEEAIVALVERTVPEAVRGPMFEILEQMDAHHPRGPHWHLPFLGVDPTRQGRGVGSALLALVLARCDRDGLPAYLEATSPRNATLYARHGFEPVGEIRAGDSPPIVPMVRPPR